jgi:hypothetical protein
MSNNPPLPEPDNFDTMIIGTGERAAVSPGRSPRPRRRERLLNRDDWKTLGVLAAVVFVVVVIADIVGISIVNLLF